MVCSATPTTTPSAVDQLVAPPLKVAIIGAGASGLTTAHELRKEGQDVVIYEKNDRLGGLWVYNPEVESDPMSLDPNREIVHSSCYDSLRTNVPLQLMGFADYPFPNEKNEEPETYRPGHEEVLEFLSVYAEKNGLIESIRFETEVIRVERVDQRKDRWVVESRKNGLVAIEIFDAVVIANGHYTLPNLADFPGWDTWPGKQVHSHNFRVPEPYRDQIVVVIGDGPSAIDISRDVANVAKEVHLSSRSPSFEVKKFDLRENMFQHSKIHHANENGEVVFEEGAVINPDTIIHCTGFKYWVPFLKTDDIVTIQEGRIGPLYKQIFPPELGPNLSFVGLTYKTIIMLTIDLQAKYVAHVLSGKCPLPSTEEMKADVKRYYQSMEEEGLPPHHTHSLEFRLEYLDWLANQVGQEIDDASRALAIKLVNFILQLRGQIEAKVEA